MASKEHLKILKRGLDVWNKWRIREPFIVPDLTCADLGGKDFRKAQIKQFGTIFDESPDWDGWYFPQPAIFRRTNFSGANLGRANLAGADLSEAIFSPIGTDEVYAEYYSARLAYEKREADILDNESKYGSIFTGVENPLGGRLEAARQALRSREHAYVINASTRTSLKGADLSDADLRGADLSGALLNNANLRGADLSEVRAIGTDFEGANITGACLSNWTVSTDTSFSGVNCDYIFLKAGHQDRRPIDTEKTFAPGEMEILLRQVSDTIDLIFTDGVDWKAFFASFQALRGKYQDDGIVIQAIERKDEAFVVRLEVKSSLTKKATLDKFFRTQYDKRLKRLESAVSDYGQLILMERQEKSTLLGIVKALSESQSKKISISNSSVGAVNLGDGNTTVSENMGEQIVGDKFENITNSTIVNRSTLDSALNNLSGDGKTSHRAALSDIADYIDEIEDKESAGLLDGISKELGSDQPNNSVLTALWDGLVKALPDTAKVAESIATLGKLIG